MEELTQQEEPVSELDEMWSDVGKKAEPRWLWHAIEHQRGTVLAYVFGRRKDAVFLQRQALLESFGIRRFSTDGWGAYERHIDPEQHHVGKENTQKIESNHLNVRTRIKRLVRRTMCFSKTTTIHDLVIGRNASKVTLCLETVTSTISDAVDCIALESVSGIGAASGTVGDAQ